MTVRQYIGARYVPLFADPIQWDNTNSYEPLTVVMNEGTSYVSRQWVPAGIAISNTEYWIAWADYNAQIEAYREEVAQYNGRISTLEGKFDANGDIKAGAIADSTITSTMIADGAVATGDIADGAVTSAKIADGAIATSDIADDAVTSAKIADGTIATGDIADGAVTSAKIADGTIATGDIADDAITSAKIADGAITSAKIADGTIVTGDIADGAVTKAKIEKDILLIFGDSWTDFNHYPNWGNDVATVLGCEIVNYGVGGASFVYVPTKLVSTQITTAISEMTSAQKARVKYVIIMAGTNDHQPKAPSTYFSAVEACLKQCKSAFANAVTMFFPTSNEKSLDSESFGSSKFLYNIRDFWVIVQQFVAGSGSADSGNRYAFPKCGPCFWFNQSSDQSVFFASDKLHLSAYGKNAIVEAILDGFGVINVPWYYSRCFEQSTGRSIHTVMTPTSIKLCGDATFGASPQLEYGYGANISDRIYAVYSAMAADGNISSADTDIKGWLFCMTPWFPATPGSVYWSRISFENGEATLAFPSEVASKTLYA